MARSESDAPWHTKRQTTEPVKWDAEARQFSVTVFGMSMRPSHNPEERVNIRFAPPVLFDIRIRKAGDDSFGPGFISPSSIAVFVGIEPEIEYEVRTQAIDAKTGEPLAGTEPQIQKHRAKR